MGIRLDESLHKAVGDRTAKVLRTGLGLETVGDLLRHYPRKYMRRGQLTELSELEPGTDATVVAQVTKVSRRQMQNRRGSILTVEIRDAHDVPVEVTFFNPRGANALKPGMLGMFAGKVGEYHGRMQLTNPEFEKLDADAGAEDADPDAWAGELIPIYPATGTLPSWKIARCVRMVLDQLEDDPDGDPVPRPVRARQGLLPLAEAYRRIHRPGDWPEIQGARKRLKWDEALPMQVVLAQRRVALRAVPAVPRRRAAGGGLVAAFDAGLPFQLTRGQQEVGAEIEADLGSEHPMHRLLQGDVGSGKTMVALRAMLVVADGGGQSVLLAPTEVLAQQHHRSIVTMLGETRGADGRPVRVALLTGSQGAKERRANLLDAASGAAAIVVGTHAVIQDHVQFADLGLVVIDEQHRFGVEQRDALRAKAGDPPHVLVMTATPIPRTVAMTVFGDLETSVLGELPAGRSPIATHVVASVEHPGHFRRVWERVREEVGKGFQAYVVCPRIGDDGDGGGEDGALFAEDGSLAGPDTGGMGGSAGGGQVRAPLSVVEVMARLVEGPLQGLRVAMLHGRMAPEDKDAVMRAYAAHELDVLVATTVIEVGVNVPNSTVIVVMDADRFGVSQLHQLRGRVGRGSAAGLCLLVTESVEGSPARERLAAVASTLDGFELSKLDLEIRKEGDVLGAAQSGYRSSLRMLSVIEDEEIIRAARGEATALVEGDLGLEHWAALRAAVEGLAGSERADYLGKA